MVKKVSAIESTDTGDIVEKFDNNIKIGQTKCQALNHDHGKYTSTQE